MSESNSNKALLTGFIAALAASSCCIPPVIAFVAGISGATTSLSWMEPFRPYLIGLTIIALAYAWYAHLKSKQADDCGCAIEKPKFYQTKGFLIGMTIFAVVSISFPYYSHIFFITDKPSMETPSSGVREITISIEGMTCTGCESHVNGIVNALEGIFESTASFEKGEATVTYDQSKVSKEQIGNAINEATGYKILEIKSK
jgi:mercuric ion transport protein